MHLFCTLVLFRLALSRRSFYPRRLGGGEGEDGEDEGGSSKGGESVRSSPSWRVMAGKGDRGGEGDRGGGDGKGGGGDGEDGE